MNAEPRESNWFDGATELWRKRLQLYQPHQDNDETSDDDEGKYKPGPVTWLSFGTVSQHISSSREQHDEHQAE